MNPQKVLVQFKRAFIKPFLPKNSHAIQGPSAALRDVTWNVKDNENWLLTGPNGSGKSTLARCLVGRANVVDGHFETRIKSSALVSFADHERIKTTTDFFLSHGADLKEEGLTVESFLFSSNANQSAREAQAKTDAFDMAKDFFDVSEFAQRNLSSLSSGELRRLCLIKAISRKPHMLILDEAFDFLDSKRRAVLTLMLNSYARENPHTRIVLVSHRFMEDTKDLEFITHHLALTDDGMVETVNDNFRSHSSFVNDAQKKALESPPSKVNTDLRIESGTSDCAKGGEVATTRFEYKKRIATLVEATRAFLSSQKRDHPRKATSGPGHREVIVDIKDAQVRFDIESDPVMVVKRLQVLKGDRVNLHGPSGAGKSLLLSIIAGEHPQAFSNLVRVFGKTMGVEESVEQRQAKVALFSHAKAQSLFTNNPFKPAVDVVASGLRMGDQSTTSPKNEDELSSESMQAMNLSSHQRMSPPPTLMDGYHPQRLELAKQWLALLAPSVPFDKPYLRLSQGQRAATLMARTLASCPPLLLLDEPFAGLDVEARARLIEIIEAVLIANEDCAVIGTSHYLDDFKAFPKRIWLVRNSDAEPFRLSESAYA